MSIEVASTELKEYCNVDLRVLDHSPVKFIFKHFTDIQALQIKQPTLLSLDNNETCI